LDAEKPVNVNTGLVVTLSLVLAFVHQVSRGKCVLKLAVPVFMDEDV
jgi:hypothetical protein